MTRREQRNRNVTVALSDEEFGRARDAADREVMPLASWMRRAVLRMADLEAGHRTEGPDHV